MSVDICKTLRIFIWIFTFGHLAKTFFSRRFNSIPSQDRTHCFTERCVRAGHNQSCSVLCVKALGEQLQCQWMKDLTLLPYQTDVVCSAMQLALKIHQHFLSVVSPGFHICLGIFLIPYVWAMTIFIVWWITVLQMYVEQEVNLKYCPGHIARP